MSDGERRPLPFSILVVTDDAACLRAGRGVLDTVVRLLAPLDRAEAQRVAFLLRDKRADRAALARKAAALRTITQASGARLLIHTHADLVAELGLDGVHVDSTSDVVAARARLPARALLGASRHHGDALDGPLDYATLSPIFAPRSKPDDRAPLGLDALRVQSELPLLALGGIDDTNARACIDAGAAGVAVLGFAQDTGHPERVLPLLLRALL